MLTKKTNALLNKEKLYAEIDRHAYISFDIFDTLIKRDCDSPSDIFHEIEKKANKELGVVTHFAEARINAESIARNGTAEEITLDDIYNCFSTTLVPSQLLQLKKWEIEYERELCHLNPCIKPIYDYCLKKKKKILIISDMYLPEKVISNILEKVHIQYNQLFVSSKYMYTKSTGSLFTYVLSKLHSEPNELMHIGDNKKSDFTIPKSLGISAYCIARNERINLIINRKWHRNLKQYANLCAFINNHSMLHSWNVLDVTSPKNLFSQVGYEVEGPLLYGFVSWLKQEFHKDGIQKAFFLARDGKLMQAAYQKLGGNIENTYMYASRKALITPTLWMNPTLVGIKDSFFWPRKGIISTILKNIGLNPDSYKDQIYAAGFDMKKQYTYKTLWKDPQFNILFDHLFKEKMVENSKREYELLVKYLKQVHFEGNVAIIDIGWFGNMQQALQKIVTAANLSVTIHGYYLGLRPVAKVKSKGYLFSPGKHEFFSKIESSFNAIVELLFAANHGSTRKYQEINEKIIPVLEDWEYKNFPTDYTFLELCQQGALAFIEDAEKAKNYFNCPIDPNITFINLQKLGCFPPIKIAECFGDLHFEDGTILYIAKPKERKIYLKNPKLFFKDLHKSWWNAAFWTRCFGEAFFKYKYYLSLKSIKDMIRDKKQL